MPRDSLSLATCGTADIPPWHLTSGILLRRHSTRMSHRRNYARPTFYLIRMFHSRHYIRPTFHLLRMGEEDDSTSPGWHVRILWWHLPGQLGSSDTRDSPDPFPPTIKEITLTILTTKSPELSLTFNARYIRQDILKFSQVSWHIPDI